MSTKRDPVVAVLDYFQTADLALAQQALALCQRTVKARLPKAGQTRPRAVVPKPPKVAAAGAAGE